MSEVRHLRHMRSHIVIQGQSPLAREDDNTDGGELSGDGGDVEGSSPPG